MTVSEPIDHVGRPLNDAALPGGRRPPRWMGAADDAAFIGLLSGAANVIMELARPGVGYGVKDSRVESGRADRHPIKRARTTFTYLAVALSGTETQKQAYRRAVNNSHAEVYSKPDSPVEYNAFDKNLQMWVAACLYKGFVDVNRIFVGEMDDDTADRHYREGMTLGTTLQVPAEMWPADRKAFDEYWQESLDQIHIDDAVHEYLWPIAAGRVGNATLPRPLQTAVGRGQLVHHDRLSAATVPRRDAPALGCGQAAQVQSSDGCDRRRQQGDAPVCPAVPVQLDAAGPRLADAHGPAADLTAQQAVRLPA